MHLVLFEDQSWKQLAPLSFSRPMFAMATGASTLLEKHIRHCKPTRISLWVRPAMEAYCRQIIAPTLNVPMDINTPLDDEPALLVAGNTLLLQHYEMPGGHGVDVDETGHVRAAYIKSPGLTAKDVFDRTDPWMDVLELPHMMHQGRAALHAWDLLAWNEESLVEDSMILPHPASHHQAGPWHLLQPEQIWLSEGSKLAPGVVLDASKGPIILARGASVGANSVIQGPAYIGPNSQVQPLTVIRPGVSVGPMCKLGGEVASSIIQGNSNKGHHGYLGDSYVGEWVNLAAGTTTSNLKTTYGLVQMDFGTRKVDTGRRFLGSIIGDHSKTAIDTRLMTGTYFGYSSMVACSKLPPTHIPSFTFMTDRGSETYKPEKVMEVMQQVYARRDRPITSRDESLVRYVLQSAASIEKASQ